METTTEIGAEASTAVTPSTPLSGDRALKSYYLHVPYCETKCHYCDFFSLPESRHGVKERETAYAAIARELDLRETRRNPEASTVFFGGGTPSLVPLDVMAGLLANLPIGISTEVTIEANPSSIDSGRAIEWRRLGVNRVSMGVQALDDRRLEWLGRVHDKNNAFTALDALFGAGFENISIDYIVGVPGQSIASIESELAEVLSLFTGIRHVSAYLLTLRDTNPKTRELPSEEDQLAHLRAVRDTLADFGFEQYEISNFARPGSRALHNENYWLGGGYLGIGPSAHSYWPWLNKRAKNWASLGKYDELAARGHFPIEWEEILDIEQKRLEHLMLRLRRREGLLLSDYRAAFGRDFLEDNAFWIDICLKQNLAEFVADRFHLKGDGFFLSDEIISKFK